MRNITVTVFPALPGQAQYGFYRFGGRMGQLAGGAGGLRKANPGKLACPYEAPVLLMLSPRNVQSSDGDAPTP